MGDRGAVVAASRSPITHDPRPITHDGLGGFERPPTGEDGQAAEHDPLGVRQQIVAPVHQRPQGVVTGRRSTSGPVRAGGSGRPGGRRSAGAPGERYVPPPARSQAGCRPRAGRSPPPPPHSPRSASKLARAACARSTKAGRLPTRAGRARVGIGRRAGAARGVTSRADAGAGGSGTLSDGTCQPISPVSPSAWRLVARTRTPGQPVSSASVSAAQASSRCSQLSSTSTSSRSRSSSRSAAIGVRSASRTPSARAVVDAASDGSSKIGQLDHPDRRQRSWSGADWPVAQPGGSSRRPGRRSV